MPLLKFFFHFFVWQWCILVHPGRLFYVSIKHVRVKKESTFPSYKKEQAAFPCIPTLLEYCFGSI